MIHFHSVEIGYNTMLVQTGDLALKSGAIYSLIGSNGSGKTTFLHKFPIKQRNLRDKLRLLKQNLMV